MRNFFDDLILVFFGVGVASVITFAMGIFAARVLGINEFGKYQLLFASAQVISIIMLFGTHVSSAKYISEYKAIDKKVDAAKSGFFIFFSSMLLISFIVLYFNSYISHVLNIDRILLNQSVVFAYYIAGFMFGRSLLQGFKKMKKIVLLEILNVFFASLFFLFFYYCTTIEMGYEQYYYAMIFGYAFFIIGVIYYLRKYINLTTIDQKIFKVVLHYCMYAIVGGVSGVLLNVANRIILNFYFDFSIVGLYSAYSMASIGVFGQLINVFSTVFLPYVSGSSNRVSITKKLNKLCFFSFIISSVVVLPILFIALKLMGNEYAIHPDLFILFAVLTGINIAYQIKMWYLSAHSLYGLKKVVCGSIIAGLINIILMIFLIPIGNIKGAVWSMIITGAFLYFYYSLSIYQSFSSNAKNNS